MSVDNIPNAYADKVKEYEKLKLEGISNITDSFYNALVVDSNNEPAYLPEEIFVGYFLPYFAGVKKVTNKDTVIKDWLGVAGAPGQPVTILIGDGHTREPLFVVPPLFDSSVIDVEKRDPGEAFNNIYAVYDMQRRNLAKAGENYLINGLEDKFNKITKSPEHFTEHHNAWVDIFVRYGYLDKDKTQIGSNSNNKLDDDELIYE
jgi:hypothetical protein